MPKSYDHLKSPLPEIGWLVKYKNELGVIIRVYPGNVVKRWAKNLNKTNPQDPNSDKEKAKHKYGVTIGFPSKVQYFTSKDFESSFKILSKDYKVGCLYALIKSDIFLFERLFAALDKSSEVSSKKEK
jgi:hypothetical protein